MFYKKTKLKFTDFEANLFGMLIVDFLFRLFFTVLLLLTRRFWCDKI